MAMSFVCRFGTRGHHAHSISAGSGLQEFSPTTVHVAETGIISLNDKCWSFLTFHTHSHDVAMVVVQCKDSGDWESFAKNNFAFFIV